MYSKEKANEYIEKNKHSVNSKYRMGFHFMPPIGWMNDPNGLIKYKGKYHVFYQYYPYGTVWGPMHWGHAVSDDLVTFTDMDVVMAPDREDETGCYSGGAVINVKDSDELILMYTKNYYKNGIRKETQARAVTRDGVNFEKSSVLIGSDMLPEGADVGNFRDPNPVYIDGAYYIFVGSKTEDNQGQILVYKSDNMIDFEHFTVIGPDTCFGSMAECPDMFRLGDKDIIIFSTINKADNRSGANSCKYIIGKFDTVNKRFIIDNVNELNSGQAYYAPQTLEDDNGRRISIAWMQMWGREYYLDKNGHGWNGAFTIPRELTLRDNVLYENPICELKKYHKGEIDFCDGVVIPKTFDGEIKFDGSDAVIKFANTKDDSDYFVLGFFKGKFYLSLKNSKNDGKGMIFSSDIYIDGAEVRIILDKCSVEVFIDGGRESITSLVFIESEEYRVCVSEGIEQIRANILGR